MKQLECTLVHIATQKIFPRKSSNRRQESQNGILTRLVGGTFCHVKGSLRNSTEDTKGWAEAGVERQSLKIQCNGGLFLSLCASTQIIKQGYERSFRNQKVLVHSHPPH